MDLDIQFLFRLSPAYYMVLIAPNLKIVKTKNKIYLANYESIKFILEIYTGEKYFCIVMKYD